MASVIARASPPAFTRGATSAASSRREEEATSRATPSAARPRRRPAATVATRASSSSSSSSSDDRGADTPPSSSPPPFIHRAGSALVAATLSIALASAPAARAGVFDVVAREDKDPIEPFSLFGTVYKKYVVEVFDESGRQIIGRKKGFTAEACVDVVSERMQRFRVPGEGGSIAPGGPTSAAAAAAGGGGGGGGASDPVARGRFCETREVMGKVEKTEDMLPACLPACRSACFKAVDKYERDMRKNTGLGFSEKDEVRVKGTCAARCAKECQKSGKAYDFIIPFRL